MKTRSLCCGSHWLMSIMRALECVFFLLNDTLLKFDICFSRKNQLKFASWLKVWFGIHFPSQCWDFFFLFVVVQVFWMLSQSLCVHQFWCVWKTLSLESSTNPVSCNFASSFPQIPEFWGQGLIKTFYLGLRVPESLHNVQLWLSVLITIYCKQKLL